MSPGERQTRFPLPESLASWQARRGEIRETLWKLLGDLPERPTPKLETVDRQAYPGFTLERFRFDNGAGAVVPGYMCLPDGLQGPAPAVYYLHYHGGQYSLGKDELLKPNSRGAMPAAELTARGYVVLCIDAYGFGERQGKGPGGPSEKGSAEELSLAKLNLWLGRTLWGMMLRDELIALDALAARPEVDPSRIGALGLSMGSTRAWWMAALDERIRAAVCVCCLTRYQDLIQAQGLRQHGIYYFVPGVLRHFDTEAIVALAAPRALCTLSGADDPGSPVAGVEYVNEFVARIYGLYGAPEAFRGVVYPGVGHVFTPEMWDETLTWLGRWLSPS